MTDVRRDYYGRPLITPPDGGKPVPYTRASTLAKALDDKGGLIKWKQAMTAMGVVRDREAHNRIAAMLAADPEPWKSRKKELNGAVERAFLAGGGDRAATSGTSLHELTEQIDAGNPPAPELVPPEWRGLLDTYVWATAGYEPLDAEVFVVVDELRVAGSFDRLWRTPTGQVVIGDLKGLALDTPIPTPTGWTTMGAVNVGDEVFGSDGKPCTVTAKSPVKNIGTYVVRFDDTSSVVCDSEHIWWTLTARERRAGTEPTPKSIDQIIATLTYGSQNQHWVPMPDPLDLPDAELPIDPYLLGCWLGDGQHDRGVICKEDALFDILESDGHQCGVRQTDKRNNSVTRSVIGLITSLRQAGLVGNKMIPDEYLRASYQQRLLLVQGLMDTDGTWNTARNTAVFNSTDKALAEQVRELLLTLGQRPHIASFTASGFGKTVTAYAVEFTPIDVDPFRLPRKAEKVCKKKSDVRSRRRLIVSVEPGPAVSTACIAVDSPNHVYLCGEEMIPTHNTGANDYKYPSGVTTQIAVYSRGQRYDPETGERSPIHPELSRDVGLLVHMPLVDADAPHCDLYELDLQSGWDRAVLSATVRDSPKIPRPKKV